MFLPLSIPSPSADWASFDLGQWLRDIGFSGFGFSINIRAYAVFILIGIVVATVLTNRRLTERGAEPGIVLDIALWAVPLGLVGARIFHVLTHPNDYFGAGKNLWAVLFIWEGGIAIFGALIGGAIGVWIGCRMTGLRFWTFADALAPGLLLAQAFGRFVNYFNQELFGLPTNAWWGLQIDRPNAAIPVGLPTSTLFEPTFLFEVVWDLVGVAVILYLSRRFTLQWGKTLSVYLIWYGLGRSYFESIRIDPSLIFLGVRTNVWAAWAAVLLGLAIFVIRSRRHPGLEPSAYVPGREWKQQAAIDSDDVYSEFDEIYDGIETNTVPSTKIKPKNVKTAKSAISGTSTK